MLCPYLEEPAMRRFWRPKRLPGGRGSAGGGSRRLWLYGGGEADWLIPLVFGGRWQGKGDDVHP